MVRLVFRPYTQVGRPICTSGRYGPPPEFPLASPCPGIVHHLSGTIAHAHAPPPRQSGRDGPVVRPAPRGRDPTSSDTRRTSLSLRHGVCSHPLTRVCVRLLGPCFKTGQVASRHRRRPLTPFTRAGPRPGDVTRLGAGLRTVRPGRQSRRRRGAPSLKPAGERRRSGH